MVKPELATHNATDNQSFKRHDEAVVGKDPESDDTYFVGEVF